MNPEAKLQKDWTDFLAIRGWLVLPTHGNMYQRGFPDLYCTHSRYGARWCEMKILGHYRFTPAQLEIFPKLIAHGSGVWVIVAANDGEYKKLFQRCNFWYYQNK